MKDDIKTVEERLRKAGLLRKLCCGYNYDGTWSHANPCTCEKKEEKSCFGAISLFGYEEKCSMCDSKSKCEKKSEESHKNIGALFG